MTDQSDESGIATCIYCGRTEDRDAMSAIEVERSAALDVDVSDLAGVTECKTWTTRLTHKCRACFALDEPAEVVQ